MSELCLFVCLSLFVIGHAVVLDTFVPFRYHRDPKFMFRRAGEDGCILCFGEGDNCIAMNSYRCEYYMATSDIREEVDRSESANVPVHVPELRIEVDTMLFNLLTKAAADPQYKDCIPLVSHYTDCNKENVCVGCKVCECTQHAQWNCSTIQKCRPDGNKPHVDHKTLVTILETIKNGYRYRAKRSAEPELNVTQNTVRRISYDDMAEWMYGVNPNGSVKPPESNRTVTEEPIFSKKDDVTVTGTIEDSTNNEGNKTRSELKLEEIKEWLNEFSGNGKNYSERSQETSEKALVTTSASIEGARHFVAKTYIQPTEVNSNESTPKAEETLAFDEVMNGLSLENKNYTRRKPPLDMGENETAFDFITYDEGSTNTYKFSDVNFNEQSNSVKDQVKIGDFVFETTQINTDDMTTTVNPESISNTETVVDLLQSAKEKINLNYRSGKNIVFTDYFDQNDKDYKPRLNDINDLDFNFNAVNVMKRDVTNARNESAPSSEKVTPQAVKKNVSYSVFDFKTLQYYVLYPLTNMLNEKQKEFDELIQMRQNLIKVINTYRPNDVDNLNETKMEMIREPSLLRSKLEVTPEFKISLKAGNTSLLDKYMLKLKHDIYEVIRDIVGIQKLSDPTKPSEDMKFLIKAMKHYIHKQGFHKKNTRLATLKNFRRSFEALEPMVVSNYVKDSIIKIIDTIDKNMPLANGLKPLSRDTRKILNRIIKNNYVDEFAVIGLRVYDPHYNLTNDLRNIGTKWQVQMSTIKDCKPADQLYAMKLLHLELSTDIIKMNDALALINFAHSRRMVPVEENIGEEIISKINNDLNDIQRKLMELIKQDRLVEPTFEIQTEKPHKKHKNTSFLKQIKNLLKNSKHDIFGLLRKRIPKSEIFKELARKQLDELTRRKLSDYEKTMQKWQDNLGILEPRHKRSLAGNERFRNGIKNILPKYLRGKVNAVAAGKGTKKYIKKIEDSTLHKKKVKNTTENTTMHGSTNTTLKSKETESPILSTDNSTTTQETMIENVTLRAYSKRKRKASIYKRRKPKPTHKTTQKTTTPNLTSSTQKTITQKRRTRKLVDSRLNEFIARNNKKKLHTK